MQEYHWRIKDLRTFYGIKLKAIKAVDGETSHEDLKNQLQAGGVAGVSYNSLIDMVLLKTLQALLILAMKKRHCSLLTVLQLTLLY